MKEGNIVMRNNSLGMPYLNIRELDGEIALCLQQDTIKTIHKNMEGFTKREVDKEKAAHEAQGMIGHPTNRDFRQMDL